VSLSSSSLTNRFAQGISDAKFHALDSNRSVEQHHCRAKQQLDHQHDQELVKTIRRKLSKDPSSIFQLEHVIGRPKVTNPNVIAFVEEITIPT
jgi:hypothetical protein